MPPVIDNQVMNVAPPGGMGNAMPLSMLIDWIIQKTYHDLTVLAELLPRKTDLERKIEISQFASRVKQQFVRLLALVKWTNSASKVDKCGRILSFLHQQQMLFTDTADMLARMARETLVHARLPSFALPCAVDVLTTGTYPRLPFCIKEKIIPPEPITPLEKKQTLNRLTQIIEYRIVTSELPCHMCKPIIDDGRVKFVVDNEFEVTLTLMGDGANIPWRLLDVEILVEDPETGDGQSLVHPLQVNFIHELVQARLLDSERPLHDLYNCLHSFCQSLQLEVLNSQTTMLIQQRLGDSLRIEEYVPGKRLTLSYWRDSVKKEGKPYQQAYKLSIHVDERNANKPLQITHFPQIVGSESIKVAQAIHNNYLSVEKFLIHTIQVRSVAKLKDLERELRLVVSAKCEIKDMPAILYIPLLTPCMESEKLAVSIDTIKGSFLVSLAQKDNELTREAEDCLNSDKKDLKKIVNNLRVWLMLQRCRKTLQHVPVECCNSLRFSSLAGHPLEALGKNVLFVKLPMLLEHCLVLEVSDDSEKKGAKMLKYYLLDVKLEGIPQEQTDTTGGIASSLDGQDRDAVKPVTFFTKPGSMIPLDIKSCCKGQCGKLFDFKTNDSDHLTRKRKLLLGECGDQPEQKKTKGCIYFIPELLHIISMFEDMLPLISLTSELEKRSFSHTGIQVEGEGVSMSVTLLDILPCPGMSKDAMDLLRNSLLSLTFRTQKKDRGLWSIEIIFTNCPITSTNRFEQGPEQHVHFTYERLITEPVEKTLNLLLDDWRGISRLFSAVSDFAKVYKANSDMQQEIEVKSYTYKRFVLAYGPAKCFVVTIIYNTAENHFRLKFGVIGSSSTSNCHTLVLNYLEHHLNKTGSIAQLAKILYETHSILSSVCKLNTNPVPYNRTKNPNLLLQSFTIIPESATHIRLVFRSAFCIDIQCRENQQVSVRDGAYSVFDTASVIDGLFPVQGLQTFLNTFVDESVSSNQARRRSTTEDDNPPSPVGMDTMDTFLSMPLQSNSPATSRMQRSDMITAPSPSNMIAQSPGSAGLHVPSPSSFVPAPSPASLGMHMPSPAAPFISPQSMLEGGSPFPSSSLIMPPSGSRNWPGSPSMPGPSPASRVAASPGHSALHSPGGNLDHAKPALPSRMLPQRAWAASIPTVLSNEALNKLLTPTSTSPGSIACCPLERFLGTFFFKRQIQRVIQPDDSIIKMPANMEPGVVGFKVDGCGLNFRVFCVGTSLHIKAVAQPEFQSQWDAEELLVLERFFETKIACPPYRTVLAQAFTTMIKVPLHVLKDFVQIMRLELVPERSLKWMVQFCLTCPAACAGMADIKMGNNVVGCSSRKIIFVLQLTRVGNQMSANPGEAPAQGPMNFFIPLMYDPPTNYLQHFDAGKVSNGPAVMAAGVQLKRFMEFHNQKSKECSIFPAIRDLLNSLVY